MEVRKADVLVIGAGGAGVMAAVEAANAGASVIIVSKEPLGYGDTRIALGATSLSPDPNLGDSEDLFLDDMLHGGEYLNNQKLAHILVHEATDAAATFEGFGHIFLRDEAGVLTREPVALGGHRVPRTTSSPATGISMGHVMRAAAARADIEVIEETVCSELLTSNGEVVGAVAVEMMTGKPLALLAKSTIVAAGGAGNLYYPHTDCMPANSGDSFGLGLRAGAELVDMEQVQFMPFGITHPSSMLGVMCGDSVTAGPFGRLLNNRGDVVRENIMPMTRAQLARVIVEEIRKGGASEHGGLILDMRPNLGNPKGEAFITVAKKLLKPFLLHIRRAYGERASNFEEPWDVLPTTHYNMGGIKTDEWCRSRVPGLYACGQAQGGVMGGNRLASTSLAEIFVFGKRAGQTAAREAKDRHLAEATVAREPIDRLQSLQGAKGTYPPIELKRKLQKLMWEKVGPLRNADGLKEALEGIESIQSHAADLRIADFSLCNPGITDAVELPHMLAAAQAIAASSLERRESRGAHVRSDFPERDDKNPVMNMVVEMEENRCKVRRMEVGK